MNDRLKVSVVTVPNGYTLDIEIGGHVQGYMYFTLTELLEGFMYHVGLQEFSPFGKADISVFLEAVSKWQDNEMLVKELLLKEREITLLKEKETQLLEKLAYRQQQNERQKQRIGKLKEKVGENNKNGKTKQTPVVDNRE